MRVLAALASGLICVGGAGAASAQAAPPVTQARDAFGQRVGDESIGLYSETQVRGFSLESAGNYRLDDHYFARSGQLPEALVVGSRVRVGASALSLEFPAPSGLVQYTLRRPGEGSGGDLTTGYRQAGAGFLRAHAWAVAPDGQTSVVGGLEASPAARYPDGTHGDQYSLGVIGQRRVGDINLRAFAGWARSRYNGDYSFLPPGPSAPPALRRRSTLFGPPWAQFERTDRFAGLLGEWRRGAWEADFIYARAEAEIPAADFTSLQLTGPTTALASISLARDQRQTADSGEINLAYRFRRLNADQRVTWMARGRQSDVQSTSGENRDLGLVGLPQAAYPPPIVPDAAEPRRHTKIDQAAIGLGYDATYLERWQIRASVQRMFDETQVSTLDVHHRSSERQWLYSGSLGMRVGGSGLGYLSYVRGREEAGVAPNSASNRNEVLPGIIAEQIELGFRGELGPVTFAAAGFQIAKPTTGFDSGGRYGLLGRVRHQGVEVSVSGSPMPAISFAAGLVLLRPRLAGEGLVQGLVGPRPVAVPSTIAQASVSYDIPHRPGLSLDSTVTYTGRMPVDQLARSSLPSTTQIDLGVRFRFEIRQRSYLLRARVQDVAGRYGWNVSRSGDLSRRQPRFASVELSTSL